MGVSQEEALTSQLTSSPCKLRQRLGAYFTQSANLKRESELSHQAPPHPSHGDLGGVFNLPRPPFPIGTTELVMPAACKVHQAASSTQEPLSQVVILAGVTRCMVTPFLPGTPVAMATA